MKKIFITLLVLAIYSVPGFSGENVFSVEGNRTLLNGEEFQVIGLRCSNSLYSEETTDDLIDHLDAYMSYGINTISVFLMGSRFGDIKGYNEDASLNKTYANRLKRIIEECDKRQMVVLVGCLYWSDNNGSRAKWESWGQEEANNAIANTVRFLSENEFQNVFIDPDNEGMANRSAGFNISQMITAGKTVDPSYVIGYNNWGFAPRSADMALHFSNKTKIIPYIETEGTMTDYWGPYSKENGTYHYINVGIYTEGKKAQQLRLTKEHLDNGYGYIFASTWLQNIPINHNPGGHGTHCDPGIKWWLNYIKENYGAYSPK
ncbi:hypothetical protein [Membranihabitans maritimus]|uniref:hypothetical protein n=1 Tax=Membranihabitans maritimus TaxID=2904244 RepID=UPI001F2AE080|nr:hypothetical protein [Membranihabitans maritimus]